MLYLTTRNKHDAYTVHHALHKDTAPDGGRFLPFQIPSFTQKEVLALKDSGFRDCVAQTLNLFFPCKLTGWDVEFAVGRHPVKLKSLGSRVLAGELWHNGQEDYLWLENALARRLGSESALPPSWVRIAIRIAVLAGLFGKLLREGYTDGTQPVDLSLNGGDFTTLMAAWYLRRMGFPVGNIICACEESSGVWMLLHQGQLRREAATATPELERLISAVLGSEEACRFASVLNDGGVYALKPGQASHLREGFAPFVVSANRGRNLISGVYRTCGYVMGPDTAPSYGALQDYRARQSQGRCTLLLADRSPVRDMQSVCQTLGMTPSELRKNLQ